MSSPNSGKLKCGASGVVDDPSSLSVRNAASTAYAAANGAVDGKIAKENPAALISSTVMSGVFPPFAILSIIGFLTALHAACISSCVSSASNRIMSAPASAYAMARSSARLASHFDFLHHITERNDLLGRWC
ncbi:MAG: hypothetical protein ABJG15_01480 [Hyphomonadaceae bacterium]